MAAPKMSRMMYVRLNIMNILGGIHTTFGVIIFLLQCGSAYISWTFHNNNMFEDFFKPGFWVGPPMVIAGALCLYQHQALLVKLHKYIIVAFVVLFMHDVSFIAIKARYTVHDPDLSVFDDCATPKYPAAFILDMADHCNAFRMNNSVGQMMLAFASADIIVCLVGAFIAQNMDYIRLRNPALPAQNGTNSSLI